MKKIAYLSIVLLAISPLSYAKTIDEQLAQDKFQIEQGVQNQTHMSSIMADMYTADYVITRIGQHQSVGNVDELILAFPDVDTFLRYKSELGMAFNKIHVLFLDDAFDVAQHQNRSASYFLKQAPNISEGNIRVSFVSLNKDEVQSLDDLYAANSVGSLLVRKGRVK